MKPALPCGSLFNDEINAVYPDNSPADCGVLRRFKSPVVRKLQIKRYKRARKAFEVDGLTYQRQLLLWHLSLQFPQTNLSPAQVYRLFVKVANALMLNDLEITHWGLQLAEIAQGDQCMNPRRLLVFTGFASKLYFNADARYLELRCCKAIPEFSSKFRQWLLMSDCLYDVPLSKLNLVYSQLSSGRVIINKSTYKLVKRMRRGTDLSTEDDLEAHLTRDLLAFEEGMMKGEKLSPLDLR